MNGRLRVLLKRLKKSHHKIRRQKTALEREAGSRGCQSRQGPVPRQREPRDPHPDEQHHRHDRDRTRTAAAVPGAESLEVVEARRPTRCSTMINDILDFSKIEAGKFDLDPFPLAPRPPLRHLGGPDPPRPRQAPGADLLDSRPACPMPWPATPADSARCSSTSSPTRSSSPPRARWSFGSRWSPWPGTRSCT